MLQTHVIYLSNPTVRQMGLAGLNIEKDFRNVVFAL